MRSGGDFAEVYAEDKRSTSASLDDGRVEQVNSGRDRGAGVRVLAGETAGYAYTSDLTEGGLTAAAEAAAAAARNGKGATTVGLQPAGWHQVNHVETDPGGVPKSTKVDLLRRIDDSARTSGPSVVQVSASYADSRKDVLVANTDGLLTQDATNAERWGILHVIWRQGFYPGIGAPSWTADYGNETANHFDHVHISTNGGGYPTGNETYYIGSMSPKPKN